MGPEPYANRVASEKTTQIMHNCFSNAFAGIGCFKGTFSLQDTDGVKPYKVPPRYIAYALQEPFRKELERLQHSKY